MKKIVSLVMVLALTLAFVPLDEDVAKAASKPSVADKAEVSVGKIVKLKIKTNGFTIKSVDVTSDKSKVATASTTKKEISIKGKAAGKAKLTVRIKAKKGSKKKTFKQSVKVTVVEALNASNKGATEISKKKNAAWLDMLDFNDKSEEENAKKGLIGSLQAPVIKDDQGNIVWDVSAFDFIKPSTRAFSGTRCTTPMPDFLRYAKAFIRSEDTIWRMSHLSKPTMAGLYSMC